MRRKGIRLSFSLLFAMAGLLFFAGPASASGESIGSCVVEKLEHIMEEGHHDDLVLLNGTYADLWHIQSGEFGMNSETY